MWECVSTDNLVESTGLHDVILYLLDGANPPLVDINDRNSRNETILHRVVELGIEDLGRELIRRGADILAMDEEGICPLSTSLNYQASWLVDEFERCGREKEMYDRAVSSGQGQDGIFQYFTYFILAGYSEKAVEILNSGTLSINAEEATELMNSCRGNFESMKNPVETFELLESLGATTD